MAERAGRGPYIVAVLVALGVVALAWLNRNRIQPVVAGADAPDFEVVDVRGNAVSLAEDFADQVVLLNIWATWCAPCRAEMPSMERLYRQFSDADFEIAAVSVDAPIGQFDFGGMPGGDPVAFADSLGLTFPILLDPEGRIRRTYATTGVPESFLIGRDGIIYKHYAGETRWDSESNVELVRRLVEGG